jgi:hypothetical protein
MITRLRDALIHVLVSTLGYSSKSPACTAGSELFGKAPKLPPPLPSEAPTAEGL